MMQPPKHVLLELDEDGDLHSVDGDSDAPAVVGATEGDSPPAPARPAIAGAVPVADPTPEERRTAATPVSMLTPTLPASSAPKPKKEKTVVEMRRIGDAEWRRFRTQTDAAKAFDIFQSEVSYLVNDRSKAAKKSLLYEARRVAAAAGSVYEIPAPAVIDDGDLHSHDEAPTRRAGLRARPKQRDLNWGPGDKGPAGPGGTPKACEMRRVGDAEWRWFGSRSDAGKAFSVSAQDVSHLIIDPAKATEYAREGFEARPAPPKKRERPTKGKAGGAPRKKAKKLSVDGAQQKQNGKWIDPVKFPGREFDDLDEYRAAKERRKEARVKWASENTRTGTKKRHRGLP